MNTEIIDKLFLELSQFTTAKTAREVVLERLLETVLMRGIDRTWIESDAGAEWKNRLIAAAAIKVPA